MANLSGPLSGLGGEFSFIVPNFSQLDGTLVSEKQRVDGYFWRMMVMRKEQVGGSQGGRSKALGVYLQRVPESTSSSLDGTAVTKATILLVNQDNPDKSFSKEFTHSYSGTSTDWGYSSFLKLKDVINPAKGFITNDTIVLKAKIEVLRGERSVEVTHTSVLICPCCDSEYESQGAKQPMSLRCGHTFCSDCLSSKSNSDNSSSSVTVTCVLCKEEHAGASSRELWFPNHSVIQMIGNVILKSKYFCEMHKQNMDYYCFDDSCLICIGCAYQGKHTGHSCKPVSLAKSDVESQLELVVKKVLSKSIELSRRLELLKDEQKVLQSQEGSLVQVVEESYKQLEEIIKRQRESQLQELREHMEGCSSSVEANIRAMEEKRSQVQQTLTEFKNWQSLPNKDALQEAASLKSNLEVTGSIATTTKTPTAQHILISFTKPFSEVFSAIENLGNLEVRSSQKCVENSLTNSQTDTTESNILMPPNKRKKLSE